MMKKPNIAMKMGPSNTTGGKPLSWNIEIIAPTDQIARKPNQNTGKARLYQKVHFDERRRICSANVRRQPRVGVGWTAWFAFYFVSAMCLPIL